MKTYEQFALERKLKNFVPTAKNYNDAKTTILDLCTFPSWQYTGKADFEEILDWCENHLGDNFIWNWETFYFKTENDKLLFLLKWI